MALSYFINRKQTTCVISLSGSISSNDNEQLELCLSEAVAQRARFYVLNMAGIQQVEPDAQRPLTLFQQGLRGSSRLLVCELQKEPEKFLKAQGVVRDAEIFPDLISCLQQIMRIEKGQAS